MSAPLKRKRFTSNEQTLVSGMVTRKLWLKIPADETKDFLLYSYDRLITKHMEIGFNSGRLLDFTKRDLPSANIWRKTYVSGLHIGGRQGRTRRTVFMYRSIPKPPISTQGKPRCIWLFWNVLVKFPLFCQFRRSNAPPVRASKRIKSPTLNAICKQRRSPKEREALFIIWIFIICEITPAMQHSVTPCTHEINEYKQNRLPLETSSAKFSATMDFLFS